MNLSLQKKGWIDQKPKSEKRREKKTSKRMNLDKRERFIYIYIYIIEQAFVLTRQFTSTVYIFYYSIFIKRKKFYNKA
jgi:hypothetical protein